MAATGLLAWFTLEIFAIEINNTMELITILNHCHRFRGFVYQQDRFGPDKKAIEIAVRGQDRRQSARVATNRRPVMMCAFGTAA